MKSLAPHASPRPGLAFWLLVLFLFLPSFSVEAGAPPAVSPKRVVFLGDSLTAGLGVDVEEAYPACVQRKITAAGLPFVVVNAGVSGDTTAGGLRRVDWILRQPVDVLVVALGGNDGLRGLTPALTRSNLSAIIDKARSLYPKARVLVAGMRMPPSMGPDYTKEFKATFPEVAREKHVGLIPFLLEGVGGNPELNQADQIHPTPEGHRRIGETVWATLKPLLEASAAAVATPSGSSP
ncbi:MAG: arylesterase [Verrucomicrobia bacterium]|nr:arylesterase [Verrucomicrobiota bacterium]MBI3871253.1 arylesterase [Verrucomicrobiota bacterium]